MFYGITEEKMKTFRRIIPVLLIAALMLSLFAISASAADSVLELQAEQKKESLNDKNETVTGYEDIGDPVDIDALDRPQDEDIYLIKEGEWNSDLFTADDPFFIIDDDDKAWEFSFAETADDCTKVDDLFYDVEDECWKYVRKGSTDEQNYADGALHFIYIEHTEESECHKFEWKVITDAAPGVPGLKRECCAYCDATGSEEPIDALPADPAPSGGTDPATPAGDPETPAGDPAAPAGDPAGDPTTPAGDPAGDPTTPAGDPAGDPGAQGTVPPTENPGGNLGAAAPGGKLTYDVNDGTADSGPKDDTDYAEGTKISLNTTVKPTHADADGKKVVFIGWTAAKDAKIYAKGETAPTTVTEVTMDDDGVTVYAAWGYDTNSDGIPDACQTWYTLTFIGNATGCSSIPDPQEAATGTDGKATLNITSEKPINDGYTFKGWATSSTGKVSYQPGQKVQLTANVKLYAVWEKATNPKTGDSSNPVLWCCLMAVAAAGVAAVVIVRKKKS